MPKKIVVVNAGPRKGWNTDTLLMEADGKEDFSEFTYNLHKVTIIFNFLQL